MSELSKFHTSELRRELERRGLIYQNRNPHSFRCWVGFHCWTTWSFPENIVCYRIIFTRTQRRYCKRCGLEQERNV